MIQRFRDALDEAGFSTIAWRKEYGGQDKGAFYLFILKIQTGEMTFAIGYTEPNA